MRAALGWHTYYAVLKADGPMRIQRLINPQSIDENQSIFDLFQQCCQRYSELTAYRDDIRKLSYKQLAKLSQRFASYLQTDLQAAPGDRLLLQLPNCLALPIAAFGAWQAGLCLVMANPLYTSRELLEIARDSGARYWLSSPFSKADPDAILGHSQIEALLLASGFDLSPKPIRTLQWIRLKRSRYVNPKMLTYPAAKSWQAALRRRTSLLPTRKSESDEVALLQYTGGSTGITKAAQLTHRNLISNVSQILEVLSPNIGIGKERTLVILPLYHIFSFTVHGLVALVTGNSNVLVLAPRGGRYLRHLLYKRKITSLAGVNAVFQQILQAGPRGPQRDRCFQHLHLCIAGGMQLNSELATRWEQQTGCRIFEGYGMSETSPVISLNTADRFELGTVGRPLPSTEVILIDNEGRQIDSKECEGEIWIKGPQVTSGYWQHPQETKLHRREDGFFRTGDVGLWTTSGNLKITGRKKPMLIVSGFNVYPREVEAVLCQYPGIDRARVRGRPHPILGETPIADIYCRKDEPSVAKLRRHCQDNLAPYKIPKQFNMHSSQDLKLDELSHLC